MAPASDQDRRLALTDELSSLLTNPRYSDLKIICGGKTWNVHKNIVCMRCKFFDNAYKGGFREANENKFDLAEDDFDAVDAMLQYIYSADYKVELPEGQLKLHVQVATIADKYNLSELEDIAFRKFSKDLASVKDWSKKDWTDFVEAIETVYEGPERVDRFRIHILQTLQDHFNILLPIGKRSKFRQRVEAIPALVVDLFSMVQEANKPKANKQDAQSAAELRLAHKEGRLLDWNSQS